MFRTILLELYLPFRPFKRLIMISAQTLHEGKRLFPYLKSPLERRAWE